MLVQTLRRPALPKKILIAGYGDSIDLAKADDRLMLRRAMAVKIFVLDTAPRLADSVVIDASRGCSLGAGARQPKAGEVEIVFTSFGESK